MNLPIYLKISLPNMVNPQLLAKYFCKEFDNYMKPTDEYIRLRIQNVNENPSYCTDCDIPDVFKKSKIRYTETKSGIVLSDCYDANGGFGLLDITTISKAFPTLEIEYAISCGDSDWDFSIWKCGEKIKDHLKAEDCILGKILELLDATQYVEGNNIMTKEEDLYQTLIKLGMIGEEEMPQDLFEDTCSDLPALMSFVNDLVVNNGQDVIKQLLINLFYKK